jgi:hypothetical protein
MAANEIAQEAAETARSAKARAKSYLTLGRFADAKRVLNDGQRHLRDLKREAAASEAEVRAWYRQERMNVNKSGQFVGLSSSSEARARAARRRQIARRDLAQGQHNDVEPYRRVKARIDELVSLIRLGKGEHRSNQGCRPSGTNDRTGVASRPLWTA